VEAEGIRRCVLAALDAPPSWQPPREYLASDVSATVARIAVGRLPAIRLEAATESRATTIAGA
jgi:hypothetical protein